MKETIALRKAKRRRRAYYKKRMIEAMRAEHKIKQDFCNAQ
jgi:hypothetical protein